MVNFERKERARENINLLSNKIIIITVLYLLLRLEMRINHER